MNKRSIVGAFIIIGSFLGTPCVATERSKIFVDDIFKSEICMRIMNYYTMRKMTFEGNSFLAFASITPVLIAHTPSLWEVRYSNRRGDVVCGSHKIDNSRGRIDEGMFIYVFNSIGLAGTPIAEAAENIYGYFLPGLNVAKSEKTERPVVHYCNMLNRINAIRFYGDKAEQSKTLVEFIEWNWKKSDLLFSEEPSHYLMGEYPEAFDSYIEFLLFLGETKNKSSMICKASD